MRRNAEHFENLAAEVVRQIYDANEVTRLQDLLQSQIPMFANLSLIEVRGVWRELN